MEKLNKESKKMNSDKMDKGLSNERSFVKHEKDSAKMFRGEVTIASGSKDFYKGDVKSELFNVECKSTGQKSMQLKLGWLEKISIEAMARKRYPAVHIRFDQASGFSCEKDWVMIPASVFEEMLRLNLETLNDI